jgi:hypothetical protein
MQVFGFWTVASYANADLESETSALVGITGSLLLSWTALAASASWAALGTALVAFGVLGAVWLISPSRA